MTTIEAVSSGDQLPLLFARVRIDGLKSRPELNGTFGKAVNYVEASGRYGVALESGKETIALKPTNLSAATAEDGNTCDNSPLPPLVPPIEGHARATSSNSRDDAHYDGLDAHARAAKDMVASGAVKAGSDQEIAMYKQELAADPTQAGPWFNLALAYQARGSKKEAIQAMDRAAHYTILMSQPGAVEMNDEFRAQLAQLQVAVIERGARLMLEALKGRADLEPDASLGARLVELLLPICEARVKPMTKSMLHHSYGDVLRKLSRNEAALEQFRLAEAAAWDGGKGEHDFDSLQFIPDVLCIMATKLETRQERKAKMEEAVAAARSALDLTPKRHVTYSTAQLTLARMMSNVVMVSTDENGQVSMEVEFFQEGKRLAVAAKAAAKKKGDLRSMALADSLLEPNQPFGNPGIPD